MAWIESHQTLKDHPKVSGLSAAMSWESDLAIGRLHRLWWWTLDYAPDGDLQKYNDAQIASGMGVAISDSKRLVETLVEARWLDREPYFRVHDWWQYAGRFLQVKWKNSPENWEKVRSLYQPRLQPPRQRPRARLKDRQPNQPNRTNLTISKDTAAPEGGVDVKKAVEGAMALSNLANIAQDIAQGAVVIPPPEPKPPSLSPKRQFTDAWMREFELFFSEKYLFQGAKDGQAADRLVKLGIPTEKLIEIARDAWARPDGFNCKHATDLSRFAAAFNAIRAELSTRPAGPESKQRGESLTLKKL